MGGRSSEPEGGRGDTAGTLRAGKAQSRLPAKRDSLMTDKDARQMILSTEAEEGTRKSRENAEEVSTEVGGRNWGGGRGGGRSGVGRVDGATVKSKAKTPLK